MCFTKTFLSLPSKPLATRFAGSLEPSRDFRVNWAWFRQILDTLVASAGLCRADFRLVSQFDPVDPEITEKV